MRSDDVTSYELPSLFWSVQLVWIPCQDGSRAKNVAALRKPTSILNVALLSLILTGARTGLQLIGFCGLLMCLSFTLVAALPYTGASGLTTISMIAIVYRYYQ